MRLHKGVRILLSGVLPQGVRLFRAQARNITCGAITSPDSLQLAAPKHAILPLIPMVPEEQALVDLFGRKHTYLRVSLTEKCNFRCVYCMPEEGVQLTPRENLPTLDERRRLIDIFARLGVTKLRFTGGEPTVSNQLLPLVQYANSLRLASHGDNAEELSASAFRSIGITTNGLLLRNQLPSLTAAGLTSVNISLDSMKEDKFAKLTRRDGSFMHKVLASVRAALDAGLHTKLNCVLMAGVNDDELAAFVELTRHERLDVRFIEYMPFDGNKWDGTKLLPYRDAILRLEMEHGVLLEDARRAVAEADTLSRAAGNMDVHVGANHYNAAHDKSDTTKWYRAPGHVGRVGFINTMTDHFCGTCNRLRLTADGKLKVCLFGSEELSLLDCLRAGQTDDEVISRMATAVRRKAERLGGEQNALDLASAERTNRPMIMIGG
jgi:molybdenum cofactor biosynthesis enzyme MoaA